APPPLREGTAMAGVGFEEFSVPPGSELALPPLFGGNILESELETEVEFVDGGLSGDNLQDEEEEESQQRQRELGRRKIQALGRRCKEIEQVGRGCRWGWSWTQGWGRNLAPPPEPLSPLATAWLRPLSHSLQLPRPGPAP
uniref:TCF3 fusion partner n=1 Tax=Terrapene triunguis TaxID=2587831 RepID=A0A674IUP2_9SAUR